MNNYQHMTVKEVQITTRTFCHVLCTTGKGEPGVFADAGPAELLAAQYRDTDPAGSYRVITFQVL